MKAAYVVELKNKYGAKSSIRSKLPNELEARAFIERRKEFKEMFLDYAEIEADGAIIVSGYDNAINAKADKEIISVSAELDKK
jgi:hypothetical protein